MKVHLNTYFKMGYEKDFKIPNKIILVILTNNLFMCILYETKLLMTKKNNKTI